MRLSAWSVTCALVALAFPAGALWVHAGCNTIPTAQEQLASGANLTVDAAALATAIQADQARFGPTLAHKGALGRIGSVYLSAQRKSPLRVAPDGQCVGAGRREALPVADTRQLVAVALTTGAGPATMRVTTGGGLSCDALRHAEAGSQVTACTSEGIRKADVGVPALDLTIPDASSEVGPARVAVFRAASPADAARVLARLATTPCERLCADEALTNDLGVCVDTLYAPVALTAGELFYAPDIVKCTVLNVPSPIPWNDFAALCETGAGVTGLPACQDTQVALNMWEDGCDAVYVPIDWTKIREVSSTEKVDRIVRGKSGLSRRGKFDGGRIWVPGREFVGTLAEADVTSTGTTFQTDPRSAAIDVWYPSPQEFGLEGAIDKDKSIVHVVPRLGASYLCDDRTASNASDEACMQVATQPVLPKTRCACTDRYAAGCTCTTLSEGRFFQCATSKMPCTRHNHCNPGDTCSGRPRCQAKGTAWDPSQPLPTGGVECWTDRDCPADQQCGFLLFDVSEKRETNSSIVKLDKTIPTTGPKKQRGVCKATNGAQRKACSNGGGMGPAACGTGDGDCIGYTLEALGKK